MASLSSEELNRIRDSVNIVDVVASYINLEKKGKNYFGICPFHDDHTPSMSVSEEKQIFTCFVCGASGNVFTFIKDYENISFVEAVNKVANFSGIKLSQTINVVKKYDKEYKAYDLAIKYYKNNLKSKEGSKALEYLKSRNISEDIIEEFDIGVSFLESHLSKLLINKKFDEDMLVNIGLVNKKEGIYDIFRNRIMFPIHNNFGDPIGFSARVYNGEVDTKYINTRETYIFKKGEVLFNFHRASVHAKKSGYLILCEGQMDAIRIYSSGIKNVCATMGTALTNYHINLIKKLNVRVILNMDSDNAGIKAALQNGELLRNNNIDVSILKLNDAKDPDEYIIKFGKEAYEDSLKHAISLFDFKLNYLKLNKDLSKADELTEYINDVINELNKYNDDVLKSITINKISEEYNIDKNILLNKLIKPVNPIKEEVTINVSKKKSNQNIKAIEEVLYYMMNNVQYANIFVKELNYVPEQKYLDIEKDIQAYIILNNTINMADFITYEMNKGKDGIIKEIINNHNNDVEMNIEEFMEYIKIIRKWINTSKINSLKVELKTVNDINRKKEIADIIARIKRESEEYGK